MDLYIEIGGYTKIPVGKRLSNFYPRPFVLDGVACGGMEGFLQSLKCADPVQQKEIAALSGIAAKRAGCAHHDWKVSQRLHWQGSQYLRTSRGYMLLISRAYDALYEQNAAFRADLLKLGNARIGHSIGNPDMRDTTLTEVEMLGELYRLRLHELHKKLASLR
jgi:predicted NAD-dependent protein-ADP-ribosyltransferase YbiA (DUF1768 family)